MLYIKVSISFVIYFIKAMLSLCISGARSSLYISRNLVLGLLMQTCFIHDFMALRLYLFYG